MINSLNTANTSSSNNLPDIKTSDESVETNLIAHRGCSEAAPENTISAFQAAADNGFDTIELDINWTKDDVPVVIHDDKINRTARNENGHRLLFTRKCSELTYEELLNYDFGSSFSKDFAGEKIPDFDDVLEFARENDLNLYVELKKTDDFDEDKVLLLLNQAQEFGLSDNITWISFEQDYLKLISEFDNDARIGYLTKKSVNDEILEVLDELNNEDNEVFLDIKTDKLTQKGASSLSEAGFGFETWVVDDEKEYNRVSELGCSGVTTNGGIKP